MRNNSKGFSLIEVMITIILLVVGVFSIMQVFSVGIFTDSENENHTTALYLAQEKMEEIRDSASYSDIDTFIESKSSLTGDFAGFSRAVTVLGSPKQVNVIVYWNVKDSEQSIELVSLFADYNY